MESSGDAIDIDGLEAKMGYAFQKRTLFWQALTHKSYAHERGARAGVRSPVRAGGAAHYERLEFLGDAVVGLAVGDRLFRADGRAPEGELTARRAALVQEGALADAARRLGLGPFLRIGRGEELAGARTRDAILADVVEALVGAIYLDGGWEVAKRFAVRHLVDAAGNVGAPDHPVQNPKGALQEALQGAGGKAPDYRVVAAEGPAHARVFRAQVWVDGRLCGEGEARSKKAAEMEAARLALSKIGRRGLPK